jgi:ketosteroid isomerase-like protein
MDSEMKEQSSKDSVVNDLRGTNRRAVEAFLNVVPETRDGRREGFLEARRRIGVLADTFVKELPFAPPGMRSRDEGDAVHQSRSHWLTSVLHGFKRTRAPVVHEMLDPTTFWVETSGGGKATWWGKEMEYHNTHLIFFVVDNGKVSLCREYFNPLNFYPPGTVPDLPFSG